MAASSASIPSRMALVLFAGTLLILSAASSNLITTVAAQGGGGGDSDKCNVDVAGLIQNCEQYIMVGGPKSPPSAACCGVVKKTDLGCACKLIDGKEIPPSVSIDKVCYVASYCKNPFKPGTKCGSYVVPANC